MVNTMVELRKGKQTAEECTALQMCIRDRSQRFRVGCSVLQIKFALNKGEPFIQLGYS